VVWDGVGFEMAHVGLLCVGIGWERDPQVTFGAGAELVTDFEGVGSMRNHFVATSFVGGYGFYTRVGPGGKSHRHRQPLGFVRISHRGAILARPVTVPGAGLTHLGAHT
jgi:hypothetical protein